MPNQDGLLQDDRPIWPPNENSPRILFMRGITTNKPRSERIKSFVFAVVNTTNTALGTGVLSFGFAFSRCGWLMGIILAVLSSSLMGYALAVILRAARVANTKSYQDTVEALYGPKCGQFLTCVLIFYNFMACVAYLLVMGSQATDLIKSFHNVPSLLEDQKIIMCFFVLVSTPLCFLKSIEALGPVSTLGVISVFFFIGVVIYYGATTKHYKPTKMFILEPSALQSIPIFFFALFCHIAIIPSCEEIRDYWPSKNRKDKIRMRTLGWVCIFIMMICVILYIPSGLFGYMMFGKGVDEDELQNFAPSWSVDVSRACMALTTFFSFPVLTYLNRGAIFDILGWDLTCVRPFTFTIFTLAHMVSTLGLAIAFYIVDLDIGFIMSIVGSTAAVIIELIFPALFLWTLKRKVQSVLMMSCGIFVCVMGLFISISNKACHNSSSQFCKTLGLT